MTRKDFQLIADVLKESRPINQPHRQGEWNAVVKGFVAKLPSTNAKFKPERFIDACGGWIVVPGSY